MNVPSYEQLRRLTQAALIGPDGVSLNWLKLLQDFQKEASPAAISELLDRLEAAEKERDSYKLAFIEYSERTEWVQRGVSDGTISAKYLGWHRADVMSDLLSAAEKERESWKGLAQQFGNELDTVRAKVAEMEKQEPVGIAGPMPGTSGFTVACFSADEVTVGTNLYLAPGAKGE